jgi:hypothetical protein
MLGTHLSGLSAGGQIRLAKPGLAGRWAWRPTVGGFPDAEEPRSKRLGSNSGIFAALDALLIGVDHAPVERTWELYEATEGGATAGPKPEPPAANHTDASVTPLFGVTKGGAFFGLGGRFQ